MPEIKVPVDKLEAEVKKQPTGPPFANVSVDGVEVQHLARIGRRYWFEYHCNESHDSGDAEVWYHSHQQCVVLGFSECDPASYTTFEERMDGGMVLVYRVRFDDGLEWEVFEDELSDSRKHFCRPILQNQERKQWTLKRLKNYLGFDFLNVKCLLKLNMDHLWCRCFSQVLAMKFGQQWIKRDRPGWERALVVTSEQRISSRMVTR